MNSVLHHTASLRVAADHPALVGHFPGRPIVPGVVLLQSVLEEAQRWLQRPVAAMQLPNAKFTAPLLPGEQAELQLKLDGDELRFSLSREGAAIAQGMFRISGRSA